MMSSLADDPLTDTTKVFPALPSCEDVYENQQAWSSTLQHEGGHLLSPVHGKCAPNERTEAQTQISAAKGTTVAVSCQQMPGRSALEAPQSDVAADAVQEQTPPLVPQTRFIVDQRPLHQAADLLPQTNGACDAEASVSADIELPCIHPGHGVTGGGGQATVCTGPTEADVAWWLEMVWYKAFSAVAASAAAAQVTAMETSSRARTAVASTFRRHPTWVPLR